MNAFVPYEWISIHSVFAYFISLSRWNFEIIRLGNSKKAERNGLHCERFLLEQNVANPMEMVITSFLLKIPEISS